MTLGVDGYETWRAILRGERPGVYEDCPVAGFWRVRSAGPYSDFVPLATFEHDGRMVALRNGIEVSLDDVWPYYARHAIAEETYRAVAERGEPWPKKGKAA